jgi:hypothetical protein
MVHPSAMDSLRHDAFAPLMPAKEQVRRIGNAMPRPEAARIAHPLQYDEPV